MFEGSLLFFCGWFGVFVGLVVLLLVYLMVLFAVSRLIVCSLVGIESFCLISGLGLFRQLRSSAVPHLGFGFLY